MKPLAFRTEGWAVAELARLTRRSPVDPASIAIPSGDRPARPLGVGPV